MHDNLGHREVAKPLGVGRDDVPGRGKQPVTFAAFREIPWSLFGTMASAKSQLTFRTPYLARRQGSSLLARVAGALTGRAFGGLSAPDPPVRDARLVAYVGHDTNISNLGGLLGATWVMPGYPVDETPPGGALMFERRRAGDGRERVFLSFVAQTPDQMRSAAPLTSTAPPIRTPVRIPGCSTEEDGFPCSVDDFARVVREALDADCVARL